LGVLAAKMYQKYINKRNIKQLNEYLDTRRLNLSNQIKKVLHILPTMTCFGKCSYCYNQDVIINTDYKCLEPYQLKSFLDDINNKDIEMIRFYGGEPGLAYLNLFRYVLIVDDISPNLKDIYISSSLLFSDEIFDGFYRAIKQITEQLPHLNIQIGSTTDFGSIPFTRGCHTNNISQKDILKRMHLLSLLNINVKVNNILTSQTNINKFKLDLDYCLIEYPNIEIRIVIANDDFFIPSKSFLRQFYFFIKPYILKEDNIYCNYRYEEKLDQTFKLNLDCGIYSNLLTIGADGQRLNCHYKLDKYEELEDSNNFDFMVNLNEKCLNCPALFVCNGGCVLRHNNQSKNTDGIYCYWIKLSVLLSLRRLLK